MATKKEEERKTSLENLNKALEQLVRLQQSGRADGGTIEKINEITKRIIELTK